MFEQISLPWMWLGFGVFTGFAGAFYTRAGIDFFCSGCLSGKYIAGIHAAFLRNAAIDISVGIFVVVGAGSEIS